MDRSRDGALPGALALAAAEGLRLEAAFLGAGFAAFRGLAEAVARAADFLAGLGAGFVFRVGMGKSASVQIYQRSGTGRRDGMRQPFAVAGGPTTLTDFSAIIFLEQATAQTS
jgi:hypothetical protein